MLRRLIRGALMLGAALIALLCILFGSLWIGHRATLTLPAPSGPFAVARHSEEWRDDDRPDPLVPTARTDLVVWFWYPTPRPANGKRSEHLPADWVRAALRHRKGTHIHVTLHADLPLPLSRRLSGAPHRWQAARPRARRLAG